jgi:phosphate transport system permease protein
LTGDRIYRWAITACALSIPLVLVVATIAIGLGAWPALQAFGGQFLWTTEWDVAKDVFGALPAIHGTLVTSAIALLIAAPLALGVAIFLAEFAPNWLRHPVAFFVELLAAIPSVVYGLWGVFVLIPVLRRYVVPFLRDTLHLSETPLFTGAFYGNSLLAAGVILGIMALPYIAAVAREVLLAVPRAQREAALALGATRWETIWHAVIPYARSGILGGIILGLARALGETMAVTMVVGNSYDINVSLLAPAYTLASVIANEFTEATSSMHLSALMGIGCVLLGITITVNAIARWLVSRVGQRATL